MTNSKITFFPVGDKNGGMILIRLNDTNKTTILIDSSIPSDKVADHCDVNKELRKRLPKDSSSRPYVDAFILTHRHEDHLQGIEDNFHFGVLSDYKSSDNKIIIHELWSSHNFWKPHSENYKLCEAAKSFNKEMKRRVKLFTDNNKSIQAEGNRAIVIGKDPDGRTNGLSAINYDIGNLFTKINNRGLSSKISGLILSPVEEQEENDDDFTTDKNRQSIVINLTIKQGDYSNKILLAADAECLVWETLNETVTSEDLEYDILTAPHHCSWHSLSYDSQSNDDDPQVNASAKGALSHTKTGAFIISQSKAIKKNDADPPSYEAKKEYLTILSKPKQFMCTNEYPSKNKPEPIEFELTSDGPQLKAVKAKAKTTQAATAATTESYPHG